MYHASRFATAAVAVLFILAGAAAAQGFAVDGGVGTAGVTGNVQVKITPYVALRGGYNSLSYTQEDEVYDDVTYDAELDFSTIGGFVDLHPFKNGFTLTGGVYQGTKQLIFDATPTENVEIGDVSFTPAQVGELNGTATLEETAPYFGVGWDSALYTDRRLGLWIRGGVMFTGAPQVNLDASGGLVSDTDLFRDELAREEENLQDDVDDYEYYPVLSAGLSFKL